MVNEPEAPTPPSLLPAFVPDDQATRSTADVSRSYDSADTAAVNMKMDSPVVVVTGWGLDLGIRALFTSSYYFY